MSEEEKLALIVFFIPVVLTSPWWGLYLIVHCLNLLGI